VSAEGRRILVREPIADSGLELLRRRFEVVEDSESDLASIIGGFDAIIVRSATKLDASLIERGARVPACQKTPVCPRWTRAIPVATLSTAHQSPQGGTQ